MPQVVFTDPEAASAGLTSPRRRRPGTASAPSTTTWRTWRGRASTPRATRAAPAWSSTSTGGPPGVTFVGPGVGELIHAATIAIAGEVPIGRLWHAVPAYPTVSEVWLRLLETYRG
ncbi:hypothetical protein [Streptomyces sp. KL116D]|uniref:hypothetical protein n=1 Tax=Streptomyces sp. KL116D TaxID=3045152 RepID=UPI003556C7C4